MASETRREIWVHSSLGRSGLKRYILSLRKWKANPMSRIAKQFDSDHDSFYHVTQFRFFLSSRFF